MHGHLPADGGRSPRPVPSRCSPLAAARKCGSQAGASSVPGHAGLVRQRRICWASSLSRIRIGNVRSARPSRCGRRPGRSPNSGLAQRREPTRRRKVVLPAPGSPTTSSRSCCKAAWSGTFAAGPAGERSAASEPLSRRPAPGSGSSSRTWLVGQRDVQIFDRKPVGLRLARGQPANIDERRLCEQIPQVHGWVGRTRRQEARTVFASMVQRLAQVLVDLFTKGLLRLPDALVRRDELGRRMLSSENSHFQRTRRRPGWRGRLARSWK